MQTGVTLAFFQSSGTMPSERDALKISVRMGAISLWSSLTRRNIVWACCFPWVYLKDCLDSPETDIVMFFIDGELSFLGSTSSTRCCSFRGTSLVKTDWNWVFKMLALSVGSV